MGTLTPKFPNAVADNSWLTIATNQLQTSLAIPCGASDTTLGVTDASRIVQWSLLTLNDATNGAAPAISEIVLVTAPPAGNILTVQRGYDGTTAKAHVAGISVNGYIVAWHQKSLASEIEAIERTLGPNLSNVGTGVSGVFVASPFAPQFPGGNLSVGSNVITLTPVPPGVNGTDTDHWLYIDQGTGTAEPVKITGGTAVAGASSGTLIVNCAFAHSGAWRIGTATSGISEAIWTFPAGVGGKVVAGSGTLAIHAPMRRRLGMPIWIEGQGMQVTTLAVAADFPNTVSGVNGVFDWSPGDAPAVPSGGVSDLTIQFIQPDSTDVSTYTHWVPAIYLAGVYHPTFRNLAILAAWRGIYMPASTNGATFSHVWGSFFEIFYYLQNSVDTVTIEYTLLTTMGLTPNQITAFLAAGTGNVGFSLGSVDDCKISNAVVGAIASAVVLAIGPRGTAPSVLFTNLWIDGGNFGMSGGDVTIAGLRIGQPSSGSFAAISHSGGILKISNAYMTGGGTTTMIYSAPANATTYSPALEIANSYILYSGTGDVIYVSTASPYTGLQRANLSNVIIDRPTNTAYGSPTILVQPGTGSARLSATGVVFSDVGTGSCTAISFSADDWHSVVGCSGGGCSFSLAGTAKTQWFGNNNFLSNLHSSHAPMKVSAALTAGVPVMLQTENFIATETGAANAIAGALVDAAGVNVPVAAGLKVAVLLAHTLAAATANTFNLNGSGAQPIRSGKTPGNLIATGYNVGGIIVLLNNGAGLWLDLSQ